MSVSAISPISSGSSAIYALSPYLNGVTRQPDDVSTLGGDAGAQVQAYGAVALINGYQQLPAIYTTRATPAVSPVQDVLPAGLRRIDTYA